MGNASIEWRGQKLLGKAFREFKVFHNILCLSGKGGATFYIFYSLFELIITLFQFFDHSSLKVIRRGLAKQDSLDKSLVIKGLEYIFC